MKCEKCGTEMNVVRTDRELMMLCPNCGCNLVTTVSPEIVEDENEYGIYLCGPQNASREALKVVSEITGPITWPLKSLVSRIREPAYSRQSPKDKTFRSGFEERRPSVRDQAFFPYDIDDPSGDDYVI